MHRLADIFRHVSSQHSTETEDRIQARTDPALAQYMLRRLEREDISPIVYKGILYAYDGRAWRSMRSQDLRSLAMEMDGLWVPGKKEDERLNINHQKAGSIAKAALETHRCQSDIFFDRPARGLPTPEGFWEVTEWGLDCLEHSPEHKATWTHDEDIDPEARPVKFLAFLESLFKTDLDQQEKVRAIQEWIGITLAGAVTNQAKCLLFVGRGANGKSVLIKAIQDLFPRDTVTSSPPGLWSDPYFVATLEGVRLNVCPELPEYSALSASDIFKAIVSGETVPARLPFEPPFSFAPQAGHIFSANIMPNICSGDFSDGFFRRFLIINFNRNFVKGCPEERRDEDDILGEISEERGAIIHWALQGASRLLRLGRFSEPRSHTETIEQWHEDSDAVQDFLRSCCEDGASTLAALYDSYSDFCENMGRRASGKRGLAKRLRGAGIGSRKTNGKTVFDVQAKMKTLWEDFH